MPERQGRLSRIGQDVATYHSAAFWPSQQGANEWLGAHRQDARSIVESDESNARMLKRLSGGVELPEELEFDPECDNRWFDEGGTCSLDRYGSTYVLHVSYYTKNLGNYAGVDDFRDLICDSRDSFDEEFGYYHLSSNTDNPPYEFLSANRKSYMMFSGEDDIGFKSDLTKRARANASLDLSKETNLNEIAYQAAICDFRQDWWPGGLRKNAVPELQASDHEDLGWFSQRGRA